MARIGKADHPRILELVDRHGVRVAEVAAEYGCTPANIYALLGRLRREAAGTADGAAAVVTAPGADTDAAAMAVDVAEAAHPVVRDLFGAAGTTAPDLAVVPSAVVPVAVVPAVIAATVTAMPERRDERGRAGSSAKGGFGLVMRTAEGEETVTPFRSLEELLAAVKPALRGVAHSDEPVWFSVQPMDAARMEEFEAA